MTLLGVLCIFALGMAVGYEVRRYQEADRAAERVLLHRLRRFAGALLAMELAVNNSPMGTITPEESKALGRARTVRRTAGIFISGEEGCP